MRATMPKMKSDFEATIPASYLTRKSLVNYPIALLEMSDKVSMSFLRLN